MSGQRVAEPIDYRYRAFLSYSHRDTAWAKWLHAALEGYGIDKELVGRPTPVGPVPKSLRPIFRDREDFSAGHSLGEQTMAALQASQFLVVLCSSDAARSRYVDEEIRRYKMLGRAERVLPVIIGGEPGGGADDCFPPALRFRLAADGSLTDEREEPIAADARPQGDGKDIAKQKLVAGLLGVGFDEIVRRAERARKRRNRFWAALAGLFLLLAVVTTGSAVLAFQKVVESEQRLDQAIEIAYGFVTEATAMSDRFGIPVDMTIGLLKRAETALNALIAQTRAPTPSLLHRKALMLLSFATNYERLGETEEALRRAAEARDVLRDLAKQGAGRRDWQFTLGQALATVGGLQIVGRDLGAAMASLRDALSIDEALVVADPSKVAWQHALMWVRVRIGDALAYQGHLGEAAASYLSALEIMHRFATAVSRPLEDILVEQPQLQSEMIEAANRIGALQSMQGRFAEALKYFDSILAVREYLAGKSPDSIGLQTGVLDACYRLGRLQFDVGLLAESLQTLRKGLAIVEPIAAADRKNVLAQRQVVLLKDAIGRVALAQGRIDEGLALARANLANADRFAKSDPKNAVWQSYLAVGHERVGDALVARGDLTAALEAYRTEASILGIRATSGQSDPDALMWLSTARFKIGEILRTQNHRGEADDHFGAALALRDTLLSSNPDVVAYQAGRLQARWRVLEAEPAAAEQSAVLASLRELRDARKLTYEYQTWLAQAEQGLDRPPAP